jgi:hypothetical protein
MSAGFNVKQAPRIINHGGTSVSIFLNGSLPTARKRNTSGRAVYSGDIDGMSLEVWEDDPMFTHNTNVSLAYNAPFGFSVFNGAVTTIGYQDSYQFLGFAATGHSMMQVDTQTDQARPFGLKVSGVAHPWNVGGTTFHPGDVICIRTPLTPGEVRTPTHSQGKRMDKDSVPIFFKWNALPDIGSLTAPGSESAARVRAWGTRLVDAKRRAGGVGFNMDTLFARMAADPSTLTADDQQMLQNMIDSFKTFILPVSLSQIVGKSSFWSKPGERLSIVF